MDPSLPHIHTHTPIFTSHENWKLPADLAAINLPIADGCVLGKEHLHYKKKCSGVVVGGHPHKSFGFFALRNTL